MNITSTLGAFALGALAAATSAALALIAAGATIGFALNVIGAPGIA
jgi:hypothetical protein